jgi:hypothetical protein
MISAVRIGPKCGWEIIADTPESASSGCLLENGLNLLADDPLQNHPRFQKLREEKQP